jgi:hypothetical protein
MNAEEEKNNKILANMTRRFTKILEACNGLSQVEARTLLANASWYIMNEATVKIPSKAQAQFHTMFKNIIEQIKKSRGDGKEVQ